MALICANCGTSLKRSAMWCPSCAISVEYRPGADPADRGREALRGTERIEDAPSVGSALIGTVLTLPALATVIGYAAGLWGAKATLLALFLITGGSSGHWAWSVGFGAYYGAYGLLMLVQELALAMGWFAQRSRTLAWAARVFSRAHVE